MSVDAFHDLNARIDHRFSDRSRMYLSLYNGNDVLKVESEDFAYSEYTSEYRNTIDAICVGGIWSLLLAGRMRSV